MHKAQSQLEALAIRSVLYMLRKLLGLSQRGLADHLGIKVRKVEYWEAESLFRKGFPEEAKRLLRKAKCRHKAFWSMVSAVRERLEQQESLSVLLESPDPVDASLAQLDARIAALIVVPDMYREARGLSAG